MMNQLLECEDALTRAGVSTSAHFPIFTLACDESAALPALAFEWQLDEEASDCLTWQGDIDAVLGFPDGAIPHTFSAWLDVLHPDDQSAVLDAIEAHFLSHEPYRIECRALKFDGSVVHWIHSGQTTRDANGNPILIGKLELAPQGAEDQGDAFPVEHAEEEDTPITGETTGDEVAIESGDEAVEIAPEEGAVRAEKALLALREELDEVARWQEDPPVAVEVEPDEPEIAAQKRARDEQARAQSLLRVAAHLNAQLDLQEVCEAICDEAARTLNAPSAVMLFSKSRDAFVPFAVRGMPLDYEKRYIPTMRSIYDGHVAQMGTLFLFTDAQATPDLPNHKLYQEVNMRTIGIASLIRDGEVLGLLKVYSFGQSRTFDANELALLQGLADIAAQSIANSRLLAQSQRRLANLNALREIDRAILGSSDVNLALGVVIEQVVSRLGADASSALLLDPHTRTLRYAAGRGFFTNTPRRTDWQLGEGLAGRAALERRVIHVPDLSGPDLIAANFSDPDLKLPGVHAALDSTRRVFDSSHDEQERAPLRRTGIPTNEGFVSYHGVPLVANGQVKGVLELWHRAPLHFDEEDLEFLETLAGQAAIAVDNATLFRDLQRSNDELVLAYDSTLAGWSRALDLRDKETEGHSSRVTLETLRLAREMGLGNVELVNIRRGALLHDIGKMGVPDAVLLKPGPLSDEEWVVMGKHPTYALELLSPIEFLRPALDIPYCHHEKWDGSGYPRGLSGEQIPLTARLFAVVDVWDALCSDRPYRKGWPIARVLEHIAKGAGSHFDPAVVEAFLRLHEDEIVAEPEPETQPETSALPETKAGSLSAPKSKRVHHVSWIGRVFNAMRGSDSS